MWPKRVPASVRLASEWHVDQSDSIAGPHAKELGNQGLLRVDESI